MTSIPLHPALVHLPLGLAFVIPALAAGFAWAIWKGRIRPRAWLVIVILQGLLLGGGLLAMNTGEREGERVEAVVPEQAIERHELLAEQFVWATAITLAAATLVLLFRRPVTARILTIATIAGTVVVTAAAIRVGHAGGQLVYVHNAAAAYGSSGVGTAKTSGNQSTTAATDHVEQERD